MADFEFYQNTYGGNSLTPAEWLVFSRRAEEQLRRYKRIYTVTAPESNSEAMAVCAMADALAYFCAAQNGSGGAVSSASIGSVSVSYGGGQAVDCSPRAQARELLRCAKLYLDIYRGGGMMLMRQNICPVNYALCNQTVTVYHQEDGKYTRTVYDQALLDYRKTQTTDKTGSRESNSFLLVIPGDKQAVFVGDKVLLGEGPEVSSREDWAGLVPVKVPGLVVVSYADPKYWGGQIVHTEAGG